MGLKTEIHRLKGRLAEVSTTVKDRRLEAAGLISLIRDQLDPYEQDVARLKIDEAEASMDRLLTVWRELKELTAREAQLREELGE